MSILFSMDKQLFSHETCNHEFSKRNLRTQKVPKKALHHKNLPQIKNNLLEILTLRIKMRKNKLQKKMKRE